MERKDSVEMYIFGALILGIVFICSRIKSDNYSGIGVVGTTDTLQDTRGSSN